MGGQVLKMMNATLGFVCLFSGLWLSDVLMVPELGFDNPVLTIRQVVLIIYGAFLALVFFYGRRVEKVVAKSGGRTKRSQIYQAEQRFLTITGAIAFGCFIIGFLIIYGVGVSESASFADSSALAWFATVMVKIVGAPVSVAIIFTFSDLDRSSVIRVTMLGFVGSLGMLAFTDWFRQLGVVNTPTLLFIPLVLLGAAYACGLRGLALRSRSLLADGAGRPLAIARPPKQIMGKGYIAAIVITSVMLGFLRSSTYDFDPLSTPWVIVAAVIVTLALFLFKRIEIPELFTLALICTVVGILFGPFAASDILPLGLTLTGAGSVFFEVVIWCLTVWAARNCTLPIFAAAGSRLITTVGHYLGTAIAVIEAALIGTDADVIRAGSLIVAFLFFLLLIYLMRHPGLHLPVFTSVYVSGKGERPRDMGPSYRSDIGGEWIDDPSPGTGAEPSRHGQIASSESEKPAGRFSGESVVERRGDSKLFDIRKQGIPETGQGESGRFAENQDGSLERYWHDPCTHISKTYQLTARETEILEQLARGRDMPFMEEKFVISRNTIKMHIRNIYTKLDVHSKQDVIELVEEARKIAC